MLRIKQSQYGLTSNGLRLSPLPSSAVTSIIFLSLLPDLVPVQTLGYPGHIDSVILSMQNRILATRDRYSTGWVPNPPPTRSNRTKVLPRLESPFCHASLIGLSRVRLQRLSKPNRGCNGSVAAATSPKREASLSSVWWVLACYHTLYYCWLNPPPQHHISLIWSKWQNWKACMSPSFYCELCT